MLFYCQNQGPSIDVPVKTKVQRMIAIYKYVRILYVSVHLFSQISMSFSSEYHHIVLCYCIIQVVVEFKSTLPNLFVVPLDLGSNSS